MSGGVSEHAAMDGLCLAVVYAKGWAFPTCSHTPLLSSYPPQARPQSQRADIGEGAALIGQARRGGHQPKEESEAAATAWPDRTRAHPGEAKVSSLLRHHHHHHRACHGHVLGLVVPLFLVPLPCVGPPHAKPTPMQDTHPHTNPTPPQPDITMPFRVNFPSLFMALIRAPTQATPYQAVFRVAPAMNKLEIREYLTKIYGLPVKKVGGWMGGWVDCPLAASSSSSLSFLS